jgi:hypothetical protein
MVGQILPSAQNDLFSQQLASLCEQAFIANCSSPASGDLVPPDAYAASAAV